MLVGELGSPVLRAALRAMDQEAADSPAATEARQIVADLARADAAVCLRIARLAGWFKTQDLSPLGYPGWSTFCAEQLELRPSWLNALIRLMQSDLELVKAAAGEGLVPLSVAIRAPGSVTVEEQEAWLAGRLDAGDDDEPTGRPLLTVVTGEDARVVHRARSLAALCMGVAGPNDVLDRFVIDHWRNVTPADRILAQAREPRPGPDLRPPTWPAHADPATALLGPWEEPRDLAHGLQILDRLQAFRRGRVAALGMLLDQVRTCFRFLGWGHQTFDDYVRDELHLSVRSAQRFRRLGRSLEASEELRQAVDAGQPLDRVEAVGRLTALRGLTLRWLAIAPRLPARELREATGRAREESASQMADDYQQRLARAPGLVVQAMTATENGRLGTTDPRRIKVARHPDAPERWLGRQPGRLWVHPCLPAASRWFLDHVQVPPETGFRRILDVQHHTCQNPECRRRWLGLEAHHDHEKALGGSNDPFTNGRALCPSCHKRLRHAGKMAIVKLGRATVYLYPGRAVVVE